MRVGRFAVFSVSVLFLPNLLSAGQSSSTVQRDPTAIAILQKSVASMAANAPSDSSATGTVTITEGSTTENGTISIQTLGTNDTAETINLPDGERAVIYSYGDAKEINGTASFNPVLELIVVDQCADFPLPFLSAMLANSDEAIHYIGQETLNGSSVQHIQVWNTFTSRPDIQKLAPLSTRDIWIDSTSNLPVKMTYTRHFGRGAAPAIPVELDFSGYTSVNGVLYPFQISKSYNGTPWQTITIQQVLFNTGLTDSQFQTE